MTNRVTISVPCPPALYREIERRRKSVNFDFGTFCEQVLRLDLARGKHESLVIRPLFDADLVRVATVRRNITTQPAFKKRIKVRAASLGLGINDYVFHVLRNHCCFTKWTHRFEIAAE